MGMDPTQLMVTPPQLPPDPTPVLAKILQFMSITLDRQDQLNVDLVANSISTLASAYKTLTETMNSQGGLRPEDKFALEQQRLQVELDLKQQEFELKKAEKMLDMQIKSQMAERDLQHKEEQHRQNIASANVKTALQIQESEARQAQAAQGSEVSS